MFSIVIPLYNKCAFIETTLQSVLSQTFADFEVIVVDDGSTDGSAGVATRMIDDRIRLIRQENQGVSAARNTGIAAAKRPWVAFLDADDLWRVDHLAALALAVDRFPEVGFISTRWSFTADAIRDEAPQFMRQDSIQKVSFFRASVVEKDFFHTSGIAVRRQLLEDVGGFGPYRQGEDVELWVRLGLAAPCCIVHMTTDYRRQDPRGLSSEGFIRTATQQIGRDRMPTPVLETLARRLDVSTPPSECKDIELYHDFRLAIGVRHAIHAHRIWRALRLLSLMRRPIRLAWHLCMVRRR